MSFKKTVENFICEHCGHENIGSGFTDHCEKCLWSKHVDIDPGDRAESCAGMMEPVEIQARSSKHEIRIKNKCLVCGFERWAPLLASDDFEQVLLISKKNEDSLR
jgi:hypothetical protein